MFDVRKGAVAGTFVVLLITIGALAIVAAQDAGTSTAEVRIAARQLEDGRIEFGLQQRESGGWGERMLVRARYLPANVGHNRWLTSSPYPITVSRTESEIEGSTKQYGTVGTFANAPRLGWSHLASGFKTSMWLFGTTDIEAEGLEHAALIQFTCHQDDQRLSIEVMAGTIGNGFFPSRLRYRDWAQFAFGSISGQTVWEPFGRTDFSSAHAISSAVAPAERPEAQILNRAKRERWLHVALPGEQGRVIVSFDLRGAFETPVQDLLERCVQ